MWGNMGYGDGAKDRPPAWRESQMTRRSIARLVISHAVATAGGINSLVARCPLAALSGAPTHGMYRNGGAGAE